MTTHLSIRCHPRLHSLREDWDLPQREIAALLHLSQNSYSGCKGRKRALPAETLETLADFYQARADHLLGRTDVPTPYPKTRRLAPKLTSRDKL